MRTPISPSGSADQYSVAVSISGRYLHLMLTGNLRAGVLVEAIQAVHAAAAALPPGQLGGLLVDIESARDFELAAAEYGFSGFNPNALDPFAGLKLAIVTSVPPITLRLITLSAEDAGLLVRCFVEEIGAVRWLELGLVEPRKG